MLDSVDSGCLRHDAERRNSGRRTGVSHGGSGNEYGYNLCCWVGYGKRTLGPYLATIAGTSIVLGVLLDLIYEITGTPVLRLDGSVSILPEWAYIAASILFALLMVIAFVRKYATHRSGTDVDAASGSAACGCGSCGDANNEMPKL